MKKGGPGAESQAGTNREQSKYEQTVNKSATIARARSRYVLWLGMAGAVKGRALYMLYALPYRIAA